MKKLLSIMLTIAMVFSFAAVAVSAEEPEYKIVINSTTDDVYYTVYKILDLTSYNAGQSSYSYKVVEDWKDFFKPAVIDENTSQVITEAGPGNAYIKFENDYVYWNTSEDDDKVAEFAKLALEYAKANSIAGTKIVGTGSAITFGNLTKGYYLVDTTMGALCGLTTTNPVGAINAKNGAPKIEIQVNEDSTGQWSTSNTDDMGKVVQFRATINVHAGAQKYMLHNQLGDGLTFGQVTKIEHLEEGVQAGHGDELQINTDYLIETNGENCEFEVKFNQTTLDDFKTNEKIIVYYTATINKNAVVGGAGNVNTVWMTYGEAPVGTNPYQTTSVYTTTYTYGVDLVKTNQDNTLIDGAEFKIYDAQENGNEIKFVLDRKYASEDDTVGTPYYRLALGTETPVDTIVVTDGMVRIEGLDNGNYYLEETKEPEGYNLLGTRQRFTISDGNLDATFTGAVYSKGSGVHVINKTGPMMPETGGMGTTLFVTIGAIVAIGAGVLLVTKKRMSMLDD